MGLFSFIKNAGVKIFGGKTDAEKAAEVAAEVLRVEAAAAATLEETVRDLQLQVENLNVNIDGHQTNI